MQSVHINSDNIIYRITFTKKRGIVALQVARFAVKSFSIRRTKKIESVMFATVLTEGCVILLSMSIKSN